MLLFVSLLYHLWYNLQDGILHNKTHPGLYSFIPFVVYYTIQEKPLASTRSQDKTPVFILVRRTPCKALSGPVCPVYYSQLAVYPSSCSGRSEHLTKMLNLENAVLGGETPLFGPKMLLCAIYTKNQAAGAPGFCALCMVSLIIRFIGLFPDLHAP